MSRCRLMFAVIVMALFLGGGSLGQDKKTDDKKDPPTKLKGQLPPNWKKLGLTDAQVQQVYKIQADYDVKINALQEQIKKLKGEEKGELMKVLTEAQKARLKEITEGKGGESTTPPKPDVKKD
jgi:Spy/CpxP family protein refolding chaperone